MTKIIKPKDESEAAHTIADAVSKGERLEIVGNGTKQNIGNVIQAESIISSGKMSGITQYDAAELVMVAKTGTTMAEIEKALEANNQMHVFEPANLSKMLGTGEAQTIGAVAATNMSGPRRFVSGAARDSLLGVRFINGKGEIIQNGGRVMKNVTGLDLVKLMAGSWGTLGFLTEVSFKVLPRPETQITLAVYNQSGENGATLMATAMATNADISGAAHTPADIASGLMGRPVKGGITFLRLEGLIETIPSRLDRLLSALGAGLEVEELDEKTSKTLWLSIRDVLPFADSTQKPVWKISVAPMAGHKVAATILDQVEGQAFYDWQGGLIWLKIDAITDAKATLVRGAVMQNGGGHATLVRASHTVRAKTPVFHPQSAPLAALSMRIKAAMDPHGIFNIGRMVLDVSKNAA